MTLRRKLVIVGVNYAPEQTGIGPYTTGIAEHMARSGWEVTVVTGMPHYPSWRVDDSYRRSFRLTENRSDVTVKRCRQFTPSHHSFFGRALYEASFFTQTATLHRNLAEFDCIVAVVPNLGAGVIGALWARRARAPFGVIFQDLIGQAASQSGLPGGQKAARLARLLEGWIARSADRVAVVAQGFLPYFESVGVSAEKVVHLPNWAHVGLPNVSVCETRHRLAWPESQYVVLHAGNMGYKQDLGNLIATAQLAFRDGLSYRFVLMGDGAERKRLQLTARDLPNVQFLDTQPDDVFMDILAAADLLVLNERSTVVDMSLPSKITSYFKAGRPVVAAVVEGGLTSQELLRSGGAMVVPAGSPHEMLAAIQTIAFNSDKAEQLATNARAYASAHFDMKLALARFESFIHDLTAERSLVTIGEPEG